MNSIHELVTRELSTLAAIIIHNVTNDQFSALFFVLTMSTAALIRLLGYNDAFTHFYICALLKCTHPGSRTQSHLNIWLD
jgi:hypothetical protein